MSPRTGRPPIENPKSERITIRIDSERSKILEDCAKHFGISKTEVLSRGIDLMEIEKENPEAQQLFDAIVILNIILGKKSSLSKDDYSQRLIKSLRQIEFNYNKFVESVNR